MGEFLWGIQLKRQLGRITHGDADRETQNRKQMIDPALNFNTKFRNNCWFWMMSAFLKCGISSNNPVQKIEIILLITKRVGALALNTLLQTFSRSWEPGLPISLFSAGPRACLDCETQQENHVRF